METPFKPSVIFEGTETNLRVDTSYLKSNCEALNNWLAPGADRSVGTVNNSTLHLFWNDGDTAVCGKSPRRYFQRAWHYVDQNVTYKVCVCCRKIAQAARGVDDDDV